MATSAIFPRARARRGMYESFYLRAVSPTQDYGLWQIHNVPAATDPLISARRRARLRQLTRIYVTSLGLARGRRK